MTSVHQERDVTLLARTLPDGRIAFVWLCGDPTLQSQVRASLRATLPLRSDLTYDALMREWVCPASAEDRLRAWADRWATKQLWEEPTPHRPAGPRHRPPDAPRRGDARRLRHAPPVAVGAA